MNPQHNPDSSGRSLLLLSLLLLAALAGVAILTRPLTPIDETRYVSAAWEMWLRGDFLVPFKNGAPYSDKPPFLFWMFQAGWALFGVNDWWPRLVLPVFSAGGLLLTYSLARRLWPQHVGLGGQAALVLAGALLWIVFSTSVMFDVILAFWVLFGLHGVLSATDGKRSGFVLLGIAIGMGVLTKGPVILLHLLLVSALAPWWNPGLRWGRWFGGVVLAVLLGAAIALAWALPAGMSGGEAYRHAIFWGQTANRMVESFAHRRPFWWYVPLLPLLLFPWFAWPAWWKALAHHRRAGLDRGSRFCLAWMLPVFVAFCFISGKQPHYLVPLFPAFALLTARVLAGRTDARVGLPALLAAVLGGLMILAASGQIARLHTQVAALPPAWPGVVLIALAVAVWAAGRRGAGAESGAAWRGHAGAGASGRLAFAQTHVRRRADGPGDQAGAGRRASGCEYRDLPCAIPVPRQAENAAGGGEGGKRGAMACGPSGRLCGGVSGRQAQAGRDSGTPPAGLSRRKRCFSGRANGGRTTGRPC